MKRLLLLAGVFCSVQLYAQTASTVGPEAAGAFILRTYCSDTFVYTPSLEAINLYHTKPALHLNIDPDVVLTFRSGDQAFMNDGMGTTDPYLQIRGYETFAGPPVPNKFNPYGSSSVPSAILNGTLNYLLNRRNR